MKGKYLILGLLISSTTFANQLNLTIENAVNMAQKRNEDAQISGYNLKQAEKSLSRAYSELYPSLKIEVKTLKTSQNPALIGAAAGGGVPDYLFDNYQDTATVTLNQPVYTFGRLGGGIDAAKAQDRISSDANIATLSAIEATAKTLFYNALFYKRNLKISQESYDNALKNQRALRKRVSYGRISQNENLKMKADIASRRPSLVEAKRLYETSIYDLKSFLNIDEDVSVNVKGSLDLHKSRVKSTTQVELDNLIQISMLKNELDLQRATQEVTESNYLPSLNFFASYGRSLLNENFQSDNFLDQENISFGFALTMDFDLGGGQIYDGQISKIKTRVKELQLEQQKRKVKYSLKSFYQQYERLQEKRESLKDAVSLAQNSYKVALNSFSNGTISQTQLNDSELLLTNNKISYARNLLELELVSFEIEKIETTKK